jgi:two-component system, NtrC family, response regulator HydG
MTKILIVDDEESIRFTFAAFLQGEGYDVRTAKDIGEARSHIDAIPPDLIFVDILLGGHSGIDILKYVKEQNLHCPVIIITGEPSIETAASAVRLGAFDYAPKPINKDNLLRFTRVALRQKTLEDEKRALWGEKERLRVHLEAVFRSVPDAVVSVDTAMRITQANQAALEVLGLSEHKAVGKLFRDAMPDPASRDALGEVLDQTLLTGKGIREYRVECASRERPELTLVVTCALLLDSEGEFIGAVLIARDVTRLAGLERELTERKSFRHMVGKSAPMQEIYRLLEDLAETETTVLVSGESGTGKELVAEALHYSGPRASKSLVKVNCSALSENLLESELFGHVRGAYTGAVKDKTGRFQLAHKGTIFLDEIGEVSPRIQLKLLRVLQEKEFERVGDAETVKVDVRVIAATNRNLLEMVRQGEFREDLYYRLKVVETILPPLRNRREDIPLLAEHFIEGFNRQFNKHVPGMSGQVQDVFMSYGWPGNIRELKHALEHSFILSRGALIEVEHLPPEIRQQTLEALATPRQERVSKERLTQAMGQAGGNKAKAARILEVSRQTLYRKMREHGMS